MSKSSPEKRPNYLVPMNAKARAAFVQKIKSALISFAKLAVKSAAVAMSRGKSLEKQTAKKQDGQGL